MEKPFMLTYDLNSPGQKYEKLRNVIKNELQLSQCELYDVQLESVSKYL